MASGSPLLCTCAAAAASKTYYSVLGVEPGVSDENLRRAYRRAAVKWHPDKNSGNIEQAEEKFKEIQKAYDTLKDPRSRGDYDDSLRNPRRSGNGATSPYSGRSRHPEDAGDFFSTAFYTRMREQATSGGGGMGGRYRPAGAGGAGAQNNAGPFDGVRMNLFDIFRFSPGNRENLGVPKARWRNILVKLEVSLEELLSGVVKEVDVGDSIVERYKQAARTGLLSEVLQEGAAVFGALLIKCPLPISAVAFAAYVHLKLPKVPKGLFRVPILPGYRRGTKLTFKTSDGVDVTFELVEKRSQFRRSGDDLFIMMRLSPKMVKRGCIVKVPTLDKGNVSVRLRRREARDGYERRLPGLGMPRRNAGEEGSRGDLIVHFMVEDGDGGES
eukprot:g13546.t1